MVVAGVVCAGQVLQRASLPIILFVAPFCAFCLNEEGSPRNQLVAQLVAQLICSPASALWTCLPASRSKPATNLCEELTPCTPAGKGKPVAGKGDPTSNTCNMMRCNFQLCAKSEVSPLSALRDWLWSDACLICGTAVVQCDENAECSACCAAERSSCVRLLCSAASRTQLALPCLLVDCVCCRCVLQVSQHPPPATELTRLPAD